MENVCVFSLQKAAIKVINVVIKCLLLSADPQWLFVGPVH